MSDLVKHPDTMLPFGDVLKPLIASSSVLTSSDLKRTLSQKGIFISSYDKEDIFPLLLTSLLSPTEYEELKECQRSKETIPKRRSTTFTYVSDKELIRSIPRLNEIKLDKLKNYEYENYKIIDVSSFHRNEDNNQIQLNYKIERTDLSKDWYQQVNVYEGAIEISVDPSDNKLNISTEHSTDETKEINKLLVREVANTLKKESMIENEVGNVIKFGDFSNEERIKYLLGFVNDTLDETNTFTFDEITDIEISIDSESELPTDFQWMEDKVSNIKFQGKALHETDILKEETYHSSLIISSLKIDYEFNINSGNGNCTFEIEFPKKRGKSLPDKDAEFIFKLINIKYSKRVNTKSAQKVLYRIFDKYKEKCLQASIAVPEEV
ncbi:GapS4b family protein [Bacillus subtilis]|uniref:GapS4b family protein n=1 Tax=Bacillus subtilis TaxID=1423 RepID=UPI003F825E46